MGRFRISVPVGEYISIYNRGVCGDTTTDLLKRFAVEAASIEPHKIIFAIGINDSKYEQGSTENKTSGEVFRSNISSLILESKKYTNDISFIGATNVTEGETRLSATRFVNQDIRHYNDILKEIATAQEIVFINVFDVLDPTKDLFDGVHPNARGYDKLFKALISTIQIVS